jgi:hypothetical protein
MKRVLFLLNAALAIAILYRAQLLLVTQGYVIPFLEKFSEHRLLKNFMYVPTGEFLEVLVDKVCLGKNNCNF